MYIWFENEVKINRISKTLLSMTGFYEILQIFCADQVGSHLFQLNACLAAVPEAGNLTPAETQIFHGTVPGAALLHAGLLPF